MGYETVEFSTYLQILCHLEQSILFLFNRSNHINFTQKGEKAAKMNRISTSLAGNFMNFLFANYTRSFTKVFAIRKKIYIFYENNRSAKTAVAYYNTRVN